MPYELYIDDEDRAYLNGIPLSPQAKARLEDFLAYAIAGVGDDYRKDPRNRPDPAKPTFVRDFFIVDEWGDERWHTVQFAIDDSEASEGKLVVVYVEHNSGEWNW